MAKNILLVGKYSVIESLGLMFLASVLKEKGHRVGIYLLKDDQDSGLISKAYRGSYEFVGFSVYTGFHKPMLRKASVLKGDFKVIIGGPHATYFGEECRKSAHYVVVGEGLAVINEIVEGRMREGIVFVPDMVLEDNLPKPDRETLYRTYPEFAENRIKSVITSMGCPYSCFVSNTKVVTSKGPNKRIREVKIGDKLIAYDKGKLVETEVKKIFVREVSKILEIKLETGKLIRCTPEHPFYVNADWVEAVNLKVGDEIYNIDFNNKITFNKKIYNPMYNPEKVRRMVTNTDWTKVSKGLRSRWKAGEMKPRAFFSEDERKAISERMRIKNPMFDEAIRNKATRTFKKHLKEGLIKSGGGSENQKRVVSKRMLENNPMKNPETVKKAFFLGYQHKINGKEKILRSLLNENFKGEYKYVGDGKVWITNCNPDFININGKKKLIEFNGCYWHGCHKCYPNSSVKSTNTEYKIKRYSKYGFKTLSIWEHELKDVPKLIEKVGSFTFNGIKIKSIREIDLNNSSSRDIFNRSFSGHSDNYQKDSRRIKVYNLECYPHSNYFADYLLSHNCSYCFNSSYKKLYPDARVRQKPVEQIINECQELKNYPLDLIYFQDDCFGFNHDWLKEFSYEYHDKIGTPFHCQIRPEMADGNRLAHLRFAGCQGITMAIETCREDLRRDLLNRKMSNKQIVESCLMIKEFGLKLRTEQMLGIPETSFEDEIDLLKMNTDINPDLAWSSIFVPYLGTVLGDYCKENGLYDGNNDDLSDNFFSKSQLKFDPVRLRKTNLLHKVFATCSKFPNGHLLAKSFLDDPYPDFQSWFFKVKDHLFNHSLYSGDKNVSNP